MNDQITQDNNPKTATQDGQQYINGICTNCGDEIALPDELKKKLLQENHEEHTASS